MVAFLSACGSTVTSGTADGSRDVSVADRRSEAAFDVGVDVRDEGPRDEGPRDDELPSLDEGASDRAIVDSGFDAADMTRDVGGDDGIANDLRTDGAASGDGAPDVTLPAL